MLIEASYFAGIRKSAINEWLRTVGHDFLETLAGFPPHTFESRFYSTSQGLGLGSVLDRNELSLLYEAAFCATLCNLAMNGLGGCDQKPRPQGLEAKRRRLELDFM